VLTTKQQQRGNTLNTNKLVLSQINWL